MALFQGRGHYYERGDANAMRIAIDAFRKLGGETLILTNAAGGLNTEWRPPALVAITDHINFSGANPLIGYTGPDRFVPLTNAYDEKLRAGLQQAARTADVELDEGVYMWFSAPRFETPAEIRVAEISRRRSRGHVDRAGGHPCATGMACPARRLGRHQLCRRPRRR